MPAWVWFSFAVLLCVAELVGGEFVLLMIGGGALATALVSLIPGADVLWLQLLVFALTSLALVFETVLLFWITRRRLGLHVFVFGKASR